MTKLYNTIDNLKVGSEEVVHIMNSMLGGMVGAQLESILIDDEDLEEQNGNALRMIAEKLESIGEHEVSSEIRDFLENGGDDPEEDEYVMEDEASLNEQARAIAKFRKLLG